MKYKETKNTEAELNDDVLENVSSGLLKPIILDVEESLSPSLQILQDPSISGNQ